MSNISNFIKKNHIEKAFKLIETQIISAGNNLSIELQCHKRHKKIERFNVDKFYSEYILNENFYNLKSLFFTQGYYGVNKVNAVREFHFLSFENKILYYSLGIALLEAIAPVVTQRNDILNKNKNVLTYSGGVSPIPNIPKKIEKFKQWKEMSEKITGIIEEEVEKNNDLVVFECDIKSFYYNISHNDVVDSFVSLTRSSDKESFFSPDNIKNIKDVLFFIMGQNKGLPVSKDCCISHEISNVVMSAFDDTIFNETVKTNEKNIFLKYIRYVDNIYLIFNFGTKNSEYKKDEKINKVLSYNSFIGTKLYHLLGLMFDSSKSKLSFVDKDNYKDFLEETTLKLYSYNEDTKEMDFNYLNKFSPKKALKIILNNLKDVNVLFKRGHLSFNKRLINSFNYFSQEKIINVLKSKDVKDEVLKEFSKMGIPFFEFLGISHLYIPWREIPELRKKMNNHIVENFENRYFDSLFINSLKHFLDYESEEQETKRIVAKIQEINVDKIPFNSEFFVLKHLLYNWKEREIVYSVMNSLNHKTFKNDSLIMNQLKEMSLCERKMNYNSAYNHLTNILQLSIKSFCKLKVKDFEEKTSLTQKDLNDFLFETKMFSTGHLLSFLDLMDRRNNNTLSHGGTTEKTGKIVGQEEYMSKKEIIEEHIKFLLSKIDEK